MPAPRFSTRSDQRHAPGARRCQHGLLPGLCAVRSCPHWDGRVYSEDATYRAETARRRRQRRAS